METAIDNSAKQKASRAIGNLLGILAVAACVPLFFLTVKKTVSRLDYAFPWLLLLALVLPILAAWKSSKLWLLMLLCPIVLYVYGITRF